ncbi:MAG: hypothetical protein P9G45_15195 [Candidatus Contendobacter sp.]|nr:hypothetical protein [Candidatus Contendobacter sp.]
MPSEPGSDLWSPLALLNTFDRPIAFHRCFVTLTGSVTAALMLSQAVYWQKHNRHEDGWWWKTMEEWAEETGLSRREQESARSRLKTVGLLAEARRGVPAKLFYQVDLRALARRLSDVLARATGALQTNDPDCPKEAVQFARNRQTRLHETANQVCTKPPIKFARNVQTTPYNTETTTETTTTTPNPASTNERAADPETARGGGGVRDQNPEDPDGNHGEASRAANGEQTVSKGEKTNGQREELVYPAKLTATERADIAAQVERLPVVIAQQMLDVLESRIQSGHIRTNPAAVLRGVVRRYQTSPDRFDPSSGFHVAEQRHRRTEAETRLRAALEARDPVPATLPLPDHPNRSKSRPAGLQALLDAVAPSLGRATE